MSTSVTKASAVEVKRLQSTASFLFAADSARLQLPFLVEGGKHLAEEFKAAEVGVRPGERATWVVQQGEASFNGRPVVVNQIAGTSTELSVTVEGDTPTALDVLRDAWTSLGTIAGEPEVDLRDQGVFHYQTVAIVRLERTAFELFPVLATMVECAGGLGVASTTELETAPRFRIELVVQGPVGGAHVVRKFGIERRVSSTTTDRIFYTTSPLRSDEHLAFLEKLLAPPR